MYKDALTRAISNRYLNWLGTKAFQGKTNQVTREEFISTWIKSGRWNQRGGKLGDYTIWFDPSLTTVTVQDLQVIPRTSDMLHERVATLKRTVKLKNAQPRTLEEMAQISLLRSWKTTRAQEGFKTNISQDEWIELWNSSGRWSQQGRTTGEYHVAYDRDAAELTGTVTIRDCQVKIRVLGQAQYRTRTRDPLRTGRTVMSRAQHRTWAHADDANRTGDEDELRSRTPLQERINELAQEPITNYKIVKLPVKAN